MTSLVAKLAFAHRTLWKRDETYRIGVVLGPPVLLGGLVACGLWFAVIRSDVPPWAHPEPSGNLPQDGKPVSESPIAPLPNPGPDGNIAGLEKGWAATIQKVLVGVTQTPNVLPDTVARFTLPPGSVEISKIIAVAPAAGLFVGVSSGFFLVREAGEYQMTLRLRRSSFEAASCLARLAFGASRVLSQYDITVVGEHDATWSPATFDLKPGAYRVVMAFGCWRDGQMIGPGDLTLMLRRPGEIKLGPVRADEIWRPAGRPS